MYGQVAHHAVPDVHVQHAHKFMTRMLSVRIKVEAYA